MYVSRTPNKFGLRLVTFHILRLPDKDDFIQASQAIVSFRTGTRWELQVCAARLDILRRSLFTPLGKSFPAWNPRYDYGEAEQILPCRNPIMQPGGLRPIEEASVAWVRDWA
jgi:hypothetical protein